MALACKDGNRGKEDSIGWPVEEVVSRWESGRVAEWVVGEDV